MTARKAKPLSHAEHKAIILDVLLDQFNFEMAYGRPIAGRTAAGAVRQAWKSRAAAIDAYVNPKKA